MINMLWAGLLALLIVTAMAFSLHWRRQRGLAALRPAKSSAPAKISPMALTRVGSGQGSSDHADDRSLPRDAIPSMAALFECFPDAALLVTPFGAVRLANRRAMAYFAELGFPDATKAAFSDLLAVLQPALPDHQDIAALPNWRVLVPADPAQAPKGAIRLLDRLNRECVLTSTLCAGTDGQADRWVIRLAGMAPQAERHDGQRDRLRTLSHDLRSPQASILTLLALQRDNDTALPEPEFFSRIENACQRALRLADGYVQLLDAESKAYRFERVDFQDILTDAVDEMWSMAQSRHVYLLPDTGNDELPVLADRALMTRAVIHLLANAVQCSPAGGQVTCTLHADRSSGMERICCRIRDQGPGIAPDDQMRLFRCFGRPKTGDALSPDGAGLGLAFVKTVIDGHGGTVSVDSRPGSGATFAIILPQAA